MYAIIATGGKQYKVAANDVIEIETLNAKVGEEVVFDQVLMLADGEKVTIGAPLVAKAKVVGEIMSEGRGDKVSIIKFRRRKHFMKRQGHRQNFMAVKIKEIKQ